MRRSLRSTFACAAAYGLLLQPLATAHAICRVVEPIEERGGVSFDPTTLVLYVLAPQQIVDYRCPDVDAGAAPLPADAGGMTMPMTMPPIDLRDLDGGADDAGFEDASADVPPVIAVDAAMPLPPLTPEPLPPGACAGSVRPQPVRGSVVHMVVQPSVLSTAGRAGLIMPVPARPDIHASNDDVFTALGARLQPRVETTTEYIEDESLGFQCRDPKFGGNGGCAGDDDDDFDQGPSGSDGGVFYDPDTEEGDLQRVMVGDGTVSFEQALVTGDYDVTVLSASTPEALNTWFDQNGFAHDAEDDAAFAAYVEDGAWFVALDVHPAGERNLAPLVVSFRSEQIPLLHRLQYDSAGGELSTEAFVMAPYRMDAADGSATTRYAAPAGFGGEVAGFGLDAGWLTHLRFARDTGEWLEDSSLRAAPASEVRPVLERIERVRIPSSECPARARDDGGCFCSAETPRAGGNGASLLPVLLACAWIACRSRRRGRPDRH